MATLAFLVLAALLVGSALAVVLHPNPVKSAMALVVTLFLLAVVFVLLEAHMIAALQIIVYAGAIMVLFLFVIMLLNLGDEEQRARPRRRVVVHGVAWAAGALLAVVLVRLVAGAPLGRPAPAPEGYGSAALVARSLFTDYVLPFELAGLLLLVAVIGPVVLAKRGR
jgi:NADH-quinone oxidoreductase subunit J